MINNYIAQAIQRFYNTELIRTSFIPGESPVHVSGKVFDEDELDRDKLKKYLPLFGRSVRNLVREVLDD